MTGYIKLIRKFQKQLKYLIAGVVAAGIEYGSFLVLTYLFAMPVGFAQATSFLLGAITAFTFHSLWTFKGNDQPENVRKHQFVLYVALALINMLLTSIVIVMLQHMHVPAWSAKIAVMGMVTIWNFFILNKLIFSHTVEKLLFTKIRGGVIRRNYETIGLFLVITILGILFIVKTPLGAGYDEVSHVVKADATSRFEWVPTRHEFAGKDGKKEAIYTYNVSATLADFSAYTYNARNEAITSEIKDTASLKGSQPYDVQTGRVDAWGAAGYNGIAYIPNAVGMRIARVLHLNVRDTMYVSKVTALCIYAAMAAYAFFILRRYKARYAVVLTALFLPITASFTAISADGFLNAASILLGAIVLRNIIGRKDKLPTHLRIISILLALVLPLVKLPYLVISLIVPFTSIVSGSRKYAFRFGLAATICVAGFGWTAMVSGANELQGRRVYCCESPADSSAQINYIMGHPLDFVATSVKSALQYNFFDYVGGITQQGDKKTNLNRDLLLLYVVCMIAVALVYTDEIRKVYEKKKRELAIVGLAILVTGAGIPTALYVAANTVGQNYIWGVQGRYFLPLVMFGMCILPLLFMWVKKVDASSKVISRITATALILDTIIIIGYYIGN